MRLAHKLVLSTSPDFARQVIQAQNAAQNRIAVSQSIGIVNRRAGEGKKRSFLLPLSLGKSDRGIVDRLLFNSYTPLSLPYLEYVRPRTSWYDQSSLNWLYIQVDPWEGNSSYCKSVAKSTEYSWSAVERPQGLCRLKVRSYYSYSRSRKNTKFVLTEECSLETGQVSVC